MAYGQRNWRGGGGGRSSFSGGRSNGGGFGRGKSKGTAARLTGLFGTARNGLFTGTAQAEQLDGLIEKIKAAKKAGQGIVFFLWENDRAQGPRDPVFNLSADVSKPKPGGNAGPRRRRIEEDEPEPEPKEPEDGETAEDDDDDPF